MVGMLVSLVALVAIALFLAERGIPFSAAPLAAVCAVLLVVTLFGVFGVLPVGVWLVYAAAVAAVVWLFFRAKTGKFVWPAAGAGFWFFVVSSLGVILLLGVRQPMFSTWDEFSFWGTAAKLTKLNNELYVTTKVGWPWPATQTPSVISFGYFMQYLASFAEWKVYAANDILQFAAFGALVVPFTKKQWNITLPVLVIELLTPFVFVHYTSPITVSSIYLDSLGDVPMGVLFGALLALYYSLPSRKWNNMLPIYLGVTVLALTKDNIGIALAMVVSGLIFVDMLADKGEAEKPQLRKRILPALGRFGLCVGSAVGAYIGWITYRSIAAQVDPTNLGGKENLSLFQIPGRALQDFLSPEKSDLFTEITTGMPRLFLHSKTTMVGAGVVVVALVLLLVVAAAVITKSKAWRRRITCFGIMSTLGFAGYSLLITLSYIYIFRDDQPFASYERYMYAYYIGWFLSAVVLLAISAKGSRLVAEGKLALLGLCAVLCLRVWQVVPVNYSIIGFNTAEYNGQREFEAKAKEITANLPLDGKTFIVTSEDDGSLWFRYCYVFLPWQVDYSFGGGELIDQKTIGGETIKTPVTAEKLQQHLIEKGCTTLYIDNADENFIQTYGALFSDGLQSYQREETQLYTVQVTNESVELRPVL